MLYLLTNRLYITIIIDSSYLVWYEISFNKRSLDTLNQQIADRTR